MSTHRFFSYGSLLLCGLQSLVLCHLAAAQGPLRHREVLRSEGLPLWNIADAPGGFANRVDITHALEWSLKNKSRDHIIVIPQGRHTGGREPWQISRTIEIPRQHGGSIWFVGQGSNAHTTGLHCSIEWTGGEGGPMFLYSSTDWSFYGSPNFHGNAKCAIGLLTTKQGSYNAGRMTWEGASWSGFTDAAIQVGMEVAENSNECNQWGHQAFHDGPVGFRVVGHQALCQRFTSLYTGGSVGVGVQVYASGCIWVDETYFNGPLLELNAANRWPGGAAGQSTGKNNGVFHFGRLKSDTQAAAPQLIRCNDSLRADVVFDTGVVSGGDTKKGTMIQVADGVVVTCRNVRMLGGGGTIEGEGGTVILDACRRVSKAGTFADDVQGDVRLVQRDCVDYDGVPFAEPAGLTQADVDQAVAEALKKQLKEVTANASRNGQGK